MFGRPVGAVFTPWVRERSISRDDSVEEFSTVTLRVAAHSGQKKPCSVLSRQFGKVKSREIEEDLPQTFTSSL